MRMQPENAYVHTSGPRDACVRVSLSAVPSDDRTGRRLLTLALALG